MRQHKPIINRFARLKRRAVFAAGQSQNEDTDLATAKRIIDRLNKAQLDELYDYIDEALWDRQFEVVPDSLIQMGREAMAAYEAGQTQELDLDKF